MSKPREHRPNNGAINFEQVVENSERHKTTTSNLFQSKQDRRLLAAINSVLNGVRTHSFSARVCVSMAEKND
jgi:branched-subunit amino acid transport protein